MTSGALLPGCFLYKESMSILELQCKVQAFKIEVKQPHQILQRRKEN